MQSIISNITKPTFGYLNGQEQFLYALNFSGFELKFRYLNRSEPTTIREAGELFEELQEVKANKSFSKQDIDYLIGQYNPLISVIARDLGIIYYILGLDIQAPIPFLDRIIHFLQDNGNQIN